MSRLMRGILIAGVVIIALAAGGLIYLNVRINSYLASNEFRVMIGGELARVFHAEGEFMPIRWSGFSAYSDGYSAKGLEGSGFTQLKAGQVRAELNLRALFFSRRWEITRVDVEQLDVEVNEKVTPGIATSQAPGMEGQSSGAWSGFLPKTVDLQELTIKTVNFRWVPASGEPVVIAGVRTVAKPEGGGWNIEAEGGTLENKPWPVFTVHSCKLRYRMPDLYVSRAELRLDPDGALIVTGEAGLGVTRRLDLQVEAQGVPVQKFLPEDWRARLAGKVQGRIRVTGDLSKGGGVRAEGPLELKEGKLEALPVLDTIATATHTREFLSLKLQQAKAQVVWTPQTLEMSQIEVEAQTLVRVEGNLKRDGQNLNGFLEVGTSEAVLKAIPGARQKVFTTARGNYVWATPGLKLTGTAAGVEEDLSPRLRSAAVQQVIEDAPGAVKGVIDKAVDLVPWKIFK